MAEAKAEIRTDDADGITYRVLTARCEHLPRVRESPEDGELPPADDGMWSAIILMLDEREATIREGWNTVQDALSRTCGCSIPERMFDWKEGDPG